MAMSINIKTNLIDSNLGRRRVRMTKYPWQTIDPKDFIQLESTKNLTMEDVRVLTKLYQPIIGRSAYSLYQLLYSELNFQAAQVNLTVSDVLAKLDVGIPDFYNARIRLEGIGLLQVYRSEEEKGNYYYEINSPLTAENFFKDSLLRTLLIEQIGERLFKKELDQLLVKSTKKQNYEETTRSFLDVYHFNANNSNIINGTDFMPFEPTRPSKLVKTIESADSFDYNFFKEGLDQHFIRKDSLNAEIKELIYTFHIVYGIDEITMQNLVLESADVESGKINKNKFTQIVQRAYFNKQKVRGLKTNTELQKETTGKADVDQTINIENTKDFSEAELSVIRHAKKAAPANYLESIKDQKNGFVTSNETWILKELVEQSPLNKEVINILLHYILVVQGTVVLEKNYAMKIANDWAQKNVQTAEEAVSKIKELYNQPKNRQTQSKAKKPYKNNYQNSGKKESLPDWAKDQGRTNSESGEQISAQDQEYFKKRLENLRKLRDTKEDS